MSFAPGDELETSQQVGKWQTELGAMEQRMAVDGYYETEDAGYDLEYLFDLLDGFAPPYFSFGAHEGDGADYGFWLCNDAVEDAIRDGEALSVEDTSAVPDDYTGEVFHISDHGNLTLYAATDGKLVEVWAIV